MADAPLTPEQPNLPEPVYMKAEDTRRDHLVLGWHDAEQWAQAYGDACYAAGLEAGRAAPPSPSVAAPADQRINTIADGIFDYQRISEKMPPLDREGFRELIGSAIAQWDAPQPPRPGTAPLSDDQIEALRLLFKDAMDWGRSYGQRLSLSDITTQDVSRGYADLAAKALKPAGPTTPTKD